MTPFTRRTLAGPRFEPRLIGMLKCWCDAASPGLIWTTTAQATLAVNDGDTAGLWANLANNRAGGSMNLVGSNTGGAKPILKLNQQNGLRVIRTDGIGGYMRASGWNTFYAPITVVTVAKVLANATAGCLWELGSSGTGSLRTQTTTDFLAGDPGLAHSMNAGTWGVAAFKLSVVILNGGSASRTRLNGADVVFNGDGGTANSALVALTLGANASQIGGFINADYGEFMIFDKPLSDKDILAVEGYLNSKWVLY